MRVRVRVRVLVRVRVRLVWNASARATRNSSPSSPATSAMARNWWRSARLIREMSTSARHFTERNVPCPLNSYTFSVDYSGLRLYIILVLSTRGFLYVPVLFRFRSNSSSLVVTVLLCSNI